MTTPSFAPPAADPPEGSQPRPASLSDLFFSFTWLALQGFGGVLAVIQREMVERKRWLTQEQFPGRLGGGADHARPECGEPGADGGRPLFRLARRPAALAGMLAVPLLIVLVLGVLYTRFGTDPQLAGALRGMAAVSAGMIAATGIKLAAALARHPLPLWLSLSLVALGVLAVAVLRLPLVYVLLVLGGLGCTLTWRRLSP